MGVLRALVAIALIAVVASPLAGRWLGTNPDVPSVYADSSRVVLYDKNERDREKKDKNRDSDEDEKGNRERTREERRSDKDNEEKHDDSPRNPTDALGLDNFQIEGEVLSLNCGADPKQIVIRTLDGEATLFQAPREKDNRIDRLYCGDLIVGDYVFVHEAAKRTEQAYDAYYISCQQERDEGPDNTNDNDDDVDPNCTHIWNR